MAPDEIERFKPGRLDDAGEHAEHCTQIEYDLGSHADHVVAIGPRLHARSSMDFFPASMVPIRLDPGFDSSDVAPLPPPPGKPWRILLAGRAEDAELKGLDIAARALGVVASTGVAGAALEMFVRARRKASARS